MSSNHDAGASTEAAVAENGAAAPGTRTIFDDQVYTSFDSKSPASEQSPFGSQISSRRPSALNDLGNQSPVAKAVPSSSTASSNLDQAISASAVFPPHVRRPSEAPSVQSSSSSLRHAYDALRKGVFPPGIRPVRSRLDGDEDEGSDASHYDEDDAYAFEGDGPFQASSPQLQAPDKAAEDPDENFSQALDSPSVPQRRSSAAPSSIAPPMSASSSMNKPPTHAVPVALPMRRASGSRASAQSRIEEDTTLLNATKSRPPADVQTAKSATHQRNLPSMADSELSVASTPSSSLTHTLKSKRDSREANPEETPIIEDEAELERRLEAAEALDPNRPRTLKEARALAKERARLRLQAKGGGDVPEQRGQTDATTPTAVTVSSDANRQDNRRTQVIQRGSSKEKSPNLDGVGRDALLGDMSDLQAAVGEALEDVSFTSGATTTTGSETGTTLGLSAYPAASSQQTGGAKSTLSLGKKSLTAASTDADADSIAHSMQSFDSAPESPFASTAQISGGLTAAVIDEPESIYDAEGQPPTIQVIHTPVANMQQGASFPASPSGTHGFVHQKDIDAGRMAPSQSQFTPRPMQSQQRSTAPNKIARLDVYGKSIPFPAAFDPTAIIEQRRLAPWERARSYAHYCNDLMTTPTGLHVWLEMVQRPAQRIAAAANATPTMTSSSSAYTSPPLGTPVKRHVRGEGTDGSAYAASVRSDATFPTRGDGGRAKEIVHHPTEASIPESAPIALPQNLPYPLLATVSSGSSNISSGQQVSGSSPIGSRHQSRSSQDAVLLNSVDRQNSRNFFSNLGRRGSTRRPAQPTMSGLSSFGSTNSSAAKNAVSNIRSRGISLSKSSSMEISSPSTDSGSLSISSPQPLQVPPQQVRKTSLSSVSSNLSASPSPPMPASASTASVLGRSGPQGPRAPNNPSPLSNAPSYFGSLSGPSGFATSSPSAISTSPDSHGKVGLHGLSPSGGLYSVPDSERGSSVGLSAPTDYSSGVVDRRSPRSNTAPLPPAANVKSSLSYGSVRDGRRPTLAPQTASTLQPPLTTVSSNHSSDSHGSGKNSASGSISGTFAALGRRRSSNNNATATMTPEESDALDKLCDVLPDADRSTLLEYLRRANGNDLAAIGDYLQDQSKAESNRKMR